MNIEIVDFPIPFQLAGVSSAVENEQYGPTGLRLMDSMWKSVRAHQLPHRGKNHWVYLPGGMMFVGVELGDLEGKSLPPELRSLQFTLARYARHLHVGPYQELPGKWRQLMDDLRSRGETIGSPSLEVYGDHCADPAALQTTILIGLQPRG